VPVPEAEFEHTEHGLVPKGEGWFVVNAREARWWRSDELGDVVTFEGEDDARFRELGINVGILQPGQPACMYHGEGAQEDFLVLSGECVLILEGEERPLKAWDFVHCPPWTEHVIVGAGAGPSVVLAVGARGRDGIVYPVNEAALRHGAGVEQETDDPREAYARFERPQAGPAPEF
jgi:uncharacterized cupin superfamily protein